MQIPRHLAIIMDGNGRWAEQRKMPRIFGHRQGAKAVRAIVEECCSLGVKHLTLYAFSFENWQRPKDEVKALMTLLCRYLDNELGLMQTKGVRLKVIGEMERLPPAVQKVVLDSIRRTSGNTDMVLTLALSYGARNEMLRAVRKIADQARTGQIDPAKIDEETISGCLDTVDQPDPDLLIRTSGEMRISNFLLWQLAYTELYFTEVLWPDFDAGQLRKAFEEFGRRQRRFGLTREQIEGHVRRKQQEGDH